MRDQRKYWKFASRWSDTGDYGSSVLDIFFKHRLAFVYPGQGYPENIVEGDLIAISDGYQIVAVVMAASSAKTLGVLAKDMLSRYDQNRLGDEWRDNCAVKFKFLPGCLLGDGKIIRYEHRKRFCEIGDQEVIHQMEAAWERAALEVEANRFSIHARTATLEDLLCDPKIRLYVVPVFQRPYSWSEPEIERFLHDSIRSYARNDGSSLN